MKKKLTKALAMVLGVVLLVGASVFGTYAYLTSTDKVTNTFTVGNVTITLDESKVTAYGEIDGTDRVQENSYKLIPEIYTKDPVIHVAEDSENCWVFIRVENGLAAIETTDTTKTIHGQLTAGGNWALVDGETNVYAYKVRVTELTDVATFTTVTLDGNADVSTYADAKITITAYAVQADGFDTAKAAWDAANFPA